MPTSDSLTPLAGLDRWAADAQDEIMRAHQAGEIDTIAAICVGLDQVQKKIRGLRDSSDVAMLDLLPPDEVDDRGKVRRRGKAVFDGVTFTRVKDVVTKWRAREVLSVVVAEHIEDRATVVAIVTDLLDVLPATPTFLSGAPEAGGLRGLGHNPDVLSDREQRGFKLERKG